MLLHANNMFDDFQKIRGSIWKSYVNFYLGIALLASVGLWAGLVICQVSWNTNPVSNAFAAVIARETQLP